MSFPSDPAVSAGFAAVREKIRVAAERSGRDTADICLVGVCKAQPLNKVRAAVGAGLMDLGANYVQEWAEQSAAFQPSQLRWHFVGRVQRKKLAKIVGEVALIHSVDRWEVLEQIQRRAEMRAVIQDALVQVNIAGEETKAGVSPQELTSLLRDALALKAVRVTGLMFMPPAATDPEDSRPWFRRGVSLLNEVRDELGPAGDAMQELSMGMSGDYVQAVEEGATIIRVGTAIFGARNYAQG